ncbi:MAG: PH domain-containing protein [Minisyncoccia bacterium]
MNYQSLHLDTGESVILEVRKHWIVFAMNGFIMILLAFVPFVFFVLIESFFPQILNLSISGNVFWLFTFFYSVWLLFLWISFFSQWTKYYLDAWYVTEKRIIIVEQCRLFVREVSNVRFDRIQDVSLSTNGILATFLGFGNIKVQTASEDNTSFTLNVVRHPEIVRKVIFSRHNISVNSDHKIDAQSNTQHVETKI